MKTLSKLKISNDKGLQNDQLKNLKGGEWCGYCWVYDSQDQVVAQGPGCGSSEENAEAVCETVWTPPEFHCDCE